MPAAPKAASASAPNSLALTTLKNRQDFVRMNRQAPKSVSHSMIVQALPSVAAPGKSIDLSTIRVGYTVTKKIGNAVVRNRIKRRLREVARTVLPESGLLGYDYVFIAREQALHCPFEALLRDMRYVLKRVHPSTASNIVS